MGAQARKNARCKGMTSCQPKCATPPPPPPPQQQQQQQTTTTQLYIYAIYTKRDRYMYICICTYGSAHHCAVQFLLIDLIENY